MIRLFCIALVGCIVSCIARAQDSDLSHLVEQKPKHIEKLAPNTYLVDFGRVAFGNLALTMPAGVSAPLVVRFGEVLKGGRIDQAPPGSVRYTEVHVDTHPGTSIIAPPADVRNTTPPAVLTPKAWGVLTPFRWVEIEGWPAALHPGDVQRRAAFDATWNDDAASFHSSDPMLDQVWDLCHYSIKATTFAGIFVDGDRERIAYEADAYLNQLGYYAGDADPRMPRASFERLMKLPTWPTEWAPHMVFMAYADWMETGDRVWLQAHYEALKGKLLNDRVGPDGLVVSSPQEIRRGDLVDWPPAERDGFVFTKSNTVVNAFRLRALRDMAVLADALGRIQEAAAFTQQADKAQTAFQARFFDPVQGLYRDGIDTPHVSLHANLFPLAFGLVPTDKRAHVAEWLASRGMAGSVYAAQYLLEALFENGESTAALKLITASGDRSWRHMVDAGTTITWEAWDQKYKPNQDWTHAWGAAPANLLPRFVLGVQPLRPGWAEALIQPHPGDLLDAKGRIPTPRGEIAIAWTRGKTFGLHIAVPRGVFAKVTLPAVPGATGVWIGGKQVPAHPEGTWWVLDRSLEGTISVVER